MSRFMSESFMKDKRFLKMVPKEFRFIGECRPWEPRGRDPYLEAPVTFW